MQNAKQKPIACEEHFAPFLRRTAEEGLTDGAYELALSLTQALIPFELGTVWVKDGDRYRPGASVGRPLDLLEGMSFAGGDGLRAWLIEEGRVVMIPSSSRGFRHETLQGFLAAPMRTEGEPQGAIALGRTADVFTARERDLLCEIAALLATTICQSRRLTRLRSGPRAASFLDAGRVSVPSQG
ncbi:MAG: GAF domain-containing protein [Armatimonadetes bacterium]|nr:GAF domain-containing protein [Armatimonadota bacterium]